MSLRAPSGRTIARGTTDPDVDHLLGPTFELFVVENPEPGDWTVDLFGADVSPDGEEVGLLVEQTAPLNEIPVGSVTLLQEGSTITVSAAGSGDSDGSIVGYEWDFGDGTTADGADASQVYTQAGEYQVTLIVTDDAGSLGFASSSIIKVGFNFEGFRPPIDNPPMVNTANAGRVLPLKWRLTGLDGAPVSDPASFVRVSVQTVQCESGAPTEEIEESGESTAGLLYHGDGEWSYNWDTPRSYAGSCRQATIVLGDGVMSGRSAMFRFR